MAEEGDLSLKDFVLTYTLPQMAKVTQGYCNDSNCDDADFSTNDVIKVTEASFYILLKVYIRLEMHIFTVRLRMHTRGLVLQLKTVCLSACLSVRQTRAL